MHPLGQLIRQTLVHRPVTLDPRLASHGFGDHMDPEMSLTTFTPTGVPTMLFTLVHNLQPCRRECRLEL